MHKVQPLRCFGYTPIRALKFIILAGLHGLPDPLSCVCFQPTCEQSWARMNVLFWELLCFLTLLMMLACSCRCWSTVQHPT